MPRVRCARAGSIEPQRAALTPGEDGYTLSAEFTVDLGNRLEDAVARGVPLLAICRGTQETNVALGGSLHQAVQEVPGLSDHRGARGDKSASAAEQYAPAHPVDVVPGGLLARITGRASFEVNSVHGQGVKQLADGLRVEAVAPDGVIEAFVAADSPGFNLGVQWHPEWQARDNPVSMKLLRAFGDACRAYREMHRETARERPREP